MAEPHPTARKKVLVITYYWPPSGGAGVQRFLKFVKYLPGFGLDPVVLTCSNPTYPIQDPTLTADIPDGVPVHYARTIEPFGVYGRMSGMSPEQAANPATVLGSWDNSLQRMARWFRANLFVPDARIGWVPFARLKARKLIREYGIDTVITTGPPHSTHFAGSWLKRKTGIRWVADFRDPWTDIHYNRALPRTRFIRNCDLRMETSILRDADEITVTAPGTARYFSQKVDRTYHTIPNGFDPDDFSKSDPSPENNLFVIRHVGSITETCVPENLLRALKQLSNPRIVMEFIGVVHHDVGKLVRKLGLDDNVSIHPYLPHKEAIRLMQHADINVVVVHRSDDSRILIPGKLYDYLKAGRPVMVIGPPDGDAAAIVRRCRIGESFDYEDVRGPAAWIAKLASQKTGGGTSTGKNHSPDQKEIQNYSRPELTRRLAVLLTEKTI